MRKCHILHITYDMNIGGTEQVIRNLVEGLNPDQFTSSILCIDGIVGPWGKELEKKGFKHFCLHRNPGFDLSLIKGIRALLKREKIDIIHCHQYTPYTYGWFGSLFTDIPIIFTEHGRFYPDFSSPKRKFINPILQKKTSAITAISVATKNALVEYEFLRGENIEVIYNGIVDLSSTISDSARVSLKSDLDLKDNEIVFGTISRLDPIKNQIMMLHSFKAALETGLNLKLLIVGDGPQRSELTQLAKQLSLTDSVIFTGFQADPQTYLSIMDVFLLPSLSEGTSMTLLEAMSFSKPSIATAVGGTPEILQHQKTGLLTTNKDATDLTQAIIKLSKDQALRSKLGKSARVQYESKLTLKAMTQAYEALYKRLLPQ